MLEARALYVGVPGRLLVSDLSLSLRPGQCTALLGRNGSGKSSLIAALGGLREAGNGAVLLDGRPLAQWQRRERARRLGVLLQDPAGDFWGTTLDYVRLGGYPHGGLGPVGRARELLEAVDLGAHEQQRYRTLSGGERQRARLAQLLLQAPQVMLLDEPLQHLDLAHQAQVLELLDERARAGCALFMALHEPSVAARHCRESVLLYDAGRVAQGPSNIMLTLEQLETLYQCRLQPAGTFVPIGR